MKRDPQKLGVLIACTMAAVATVFEPTYLNLSSSVIQAGLRAENSPAPMFLAIAFLLLALFTLLAGTSADLFGRRLLLLAGLVGLTLSNVLGLLWLEYAARVCGRGHTQRDQWRHCAASGDSHRDADLRTGPTPLCLRHPVRSPGNSAGRGNRAHPNPGRSLGRSRHLRPCTDPGRRGVRDGVAPRAGEPSTPIASPRQRDREPHPHGGPVPDDLP